LFLLLLLLQYKGFRFPVPQYLVHLDVLDIQILKKNALADDES
jgi:hypothetical protein